MANEMTARELLLSGDDWTDQQARRALIILLEHAELGQTLTYTDLNLAIARKYDIEPTGSVRGFGMVLEKVGQALNRLSDEWGIEIPPLTILVINKETNLPGEGFDPFLQRYLSKEKRLERLTKNNRAALIDRATQDVFDFPLWDYVAEYFDLPGGRRTPQHEVIHLPEPQPRRGGGGEGEAHRKLKNYVAAHPGIFHRYGKFPPGEMEVHLLSGDIVDVLFNNEDVTLAVEVKAADAPPDELTRGIFQCVKYRAVLRATYALTSELLKVEALLTTPQTVGGSHKEAAKRLKVPIIRVKEPK